MKSKKGDVTDILSLGIITFILIVGFFIIAYIVPFITSGLSTAGLNNTVEGANAINKLNDFGVNGIQRGMFWLFIGLCIGVLISSFYVDTHPVWLFLYIMMLIVAVIVAGYLSNAYTTIVNSTSFNGFTQTYMTSIMANIITTIIVVACLSFIIIFAKWGYGGSTRF